MSPIEEALRQAVQPKKRPLPNVSAYSSSTSWDALNGWDGRLGPARKDPIFTPLFTAIFGTGGFTIFGTTISYASIASAIATTAIVTGLQYLLTPKPPKPEDGRAPLTQSIPYQFWAVGETRMAGAFMLWEAIDDKLISVQAITGHKINAFKRFYLNDDAVTLTGNIVDAIGDRYRSNRAQIFQRVGETPESAIAEIVALLGAQDVWTDNHRGDGQSSLGMICKSPPAEEFTSTFPYGKPSLSAVIEGALCWDFRDPAQDPDNEATWTFTKNSALILCWHECFSPFGSKRDYRKAILPVLDMWQEEADVCEEDVPIDGGGTEKRYECNGFDTAEHDPKAGTNAILATCDGWMCERGDGALLFVAGKFREKYVATLTDADVVGHSIQYDVLPDEEVNRLVPKFVYPATDYTTTDTDFFEDTDAQLVAGRVLPQDAHFGWVHQWRQARRLAKREWLRIQEKKRGSLDIRLTGINAVYAPWVRLQTPIRIPSLNGKLISNRRSVLALMKGGFQMNFVALPDDLDAWNPETDEGAAPPIPIKPVSDGVPTPAIDTISALASAGSVYIKVTIVDPSRDDLTPVLRYRVKDTGDGTVGQWVEQKFPTAVPSAGLILLNTNPVPGDRLLQIQVAFVGTDGTYGDWTDPPSEIASTVDTTPPVSLLTFSANGGSGKFTASFGTQNDPHLFSVAIYRTAVGQPFNPVADRVTNPAVSPGISYSIPVTSPAGSWDVRAEALNRSGIAGPLSGPSTVTVS